MTLYLKYRPKDFDSLVGQDFIKNTLRQAVLNDKLVGAYLFCGPRGTGKTSTARIFAKTINCLDLKEGNPCNNCDICREFQEESLVDIIEIDAASYTGVDNIRDIIERAQFSPTKCKYKVYIIDEVHMLSKGAFNALLKILEEPPKHLKFILATTEIHKIPETILSRCQRYDFKSITPEDLKNRLLYIAENEKIKIDNESLDFIVKQASGGLRNAISLFEQLIQNSEINFENVINNYGIPKTEVISNFYTKLYSKDTSIIQEYEEIIGNYNLNLFFKELLFFIRDELLKDLSDLNKTTRNIFIIETLEEAYLKAKNSFDGKTTFLVGIIKCLNNISKFTEEQNNIKKQETKNPPVLADIPLIKGELKGDGKKQEEISHDDLFDVFGEEEEKTPPLIPPQSRGIPSNNEVGGVNSGNFNTETFISELKKLGSKGALTMSLRGSSLQYDEKNLIIFTKTKIAMKQIALSENISLMSNALQNMGLLNINIEVK